MKSLIPYLRKFSLVIVLVQFVNISLNYVNMYNTGKSGFRHKIDLHSNEVDSFCEFVSENLLDIDYPESNEDDEEVFLENLDLGFFAAAIKIDTPPVSDSNGYRSHFGLHFPVIYAELNSPPPKA